MKAIKKLVRLVSGIIDIFLRPSHGVFHAEEIRLRKQYYQEVDDGKACRPGVVVMVDGRTMHGGMSDRLRGMASLYGYCKQRGIPFYIHHTYPFALQDYLLPNEVNWLMTEGEVSYCSAKAQPVVLMLHLIPSKLHRMYLRHLFRHEAWRHRQFHIYSNTLLDDAHYGANFHALFTPAPDLARAVGCECEAMGTRGFVGVVLRFQQLLGDFDEGDYAILPEEERGPLIDKCLARIEEIHARHNDGSQVLVTSDSRTFLDTAQSRLPYVHVISGKMVHMDYSAHAGYATYMKSFVDMLTLSRASRIYLLRTGEMYKSGFAFRAAAINGVPYEYIDF